MAKSAHEIMLIILASGATERDEVLAVLEDGAALAELGVTDEDQESVEFAHHFLSNVVIPWPSND